MTRSCLALGAMALASGCQPDATVVYYQPSLLQNVPGSVGGLNTDGTPREEGAGPRPASGSAAEALAMTEDDLIKTNPDGSKTLISRIIQHTIFHLVRTLRAGEDDLFYTQVLSDATKRHFSERGEDPRDAIAYFTENRDDIIHMLSRMPNAENTPGVIMEKTGRKDFVLRITGSAAKGLRFTEYWVTMERGQWRVMWVQ